MKQTAVEWLRGISQYRELDKFDWEQALQIEKEQIRHAWENGALPDVLKEYRNSRTYINETYETK